MELSEDTIALYESQVEKLTSELALRSPDRVPLSVFEAHSVDLRDPLNSRRNIIGCGYGEKIINGVPQGVLAIALYVVRKAPAGNVDPQFLGDSVVKQYLGPAYMSDVIEVGRPQLLHHVSRSYSGRIPGGAAIADDGGRYEGTLGGWLQDENGRTYLLSCWHCIDGVPGGSIGHHVRQPASGNRVATITASVDPAGCAPGATTVDAALAEIDDMARVGDFVLQLGELRGCRRLTSTYEQVRKYGVATHYTTGRVMQLCAGLSLYVPSLGHSVFYEKQLLIYPDGLQSQFADSKDSGSLVIVDDNHVVGMLVGGDHAPPRYVATPIYDVLNALSHGSLRFISY